MSNIEDRYPICPEEDDIYRPRVEEILGHSLDNVTFEKIAWYITDQWEPHVMEGPPEHQKRLQEAKDINTKYISYLLRHDMTRAKMGHPYPRPGSIRIKNVWKMAQTLYFMDDPSGFLGPAWSEMVYVAHAIVLAHDFGHRMFDDELVRKLYLSSIWPYDHPNDPDFYKWLEDGGMYAMFEHRGEDFVDDDFLAQSRVQVDL